MAGQFDADARVFYIPSWWRWNPPENQNVLRGNLKDLSEIPPSALCEAFARNVETLPATLRETFVECCRLRLPKRSPIQEQKQEQKQRTGSGTGTRAARGVAVAPDTPKPKGKEGTEENHLITVARQVLKLTNPNAPLDHLLDTFSSLHHGSYTRAEANQALSVALSEHRALST